MLRQSWGLQNMFTSTLLNFVWPGQVRTLWFSSSDVWFLLCLYIPLFFSCKDCFTFCHVKGLNSFQNRRVTYFCPSQQQYASLCKWVRCIYRIASVFPWHRSVSSISLSNAPIPASSHLFYDCSPLQNNTYQL